MSFWDFLPWRRPSLSDLSPEERWRAKAFLLGACPGVRPELGQTMLKICIEDCKAPQQPKVKE